MTKDELLDQLEALSHVERVRAMLALGQRDGAEVRELISSLERGDFYERFLALYSCFGSRDQSHVLRALSDPSRLIRGLAARLAVLVLDDQEAIQVFAHLSPNMRKPLLSKLSSSRRLSVVDQCLEQLATAGDTHLLALLHLGSPALVERYAAPLLAAAQPREWSRLAAHHPAVVLGILQTRAEAAAARDHRLVELVNTLLPILGSAAPDGTIALVRALVRTTPYDQLGVGVYEVDSKRPNEGADLILAQDAPVSRGVGDFANRISVERLVALMEHHREALTNIDTWFPRLDAAARAALYASPIGKRYITQALLRDYSANLLRALPGNARLQEARRQVKRWGHQPRRQMQFASCLPWDEALAVLDSGLHATDASLRAQALGALIDACAYSRDRLPELLALLQERRSEQDGVRQMIFTHLSALPPSIWRAEHLPAVEELIRHGLNDVGLSAETQQQMVALLAKVLPTQTTWAAGQLATIIRERGWANPPDRWARYRHGGAYNVRRSGKLRDLPPTAARGLTITLLPVLSSWVARDDAAAALAVAKVLPLGRRDRTLLRPLLEDILHRTRTRSDAEQALELLATHVPARLATLIPDLLADDASWITLSPVARWLPRHRPDLLMPYLSRQSYAGRWGTGTKPYLVPLDIPFTSGTRRQQEAYAAALGEVIADESLPSREWTQAIQRLALLPAIGVERLAAAASDGRSVVRTTALFALARLDNSAGVPTLVEALGDARARIAISALRPLVLRMPPDQALAILHVTPVERVTVAKEIVRLIADLKSEAAYVELLTLADGDLHRDVRIALLRSLDLYLDREPTWALLEAAVHAPDPELAVAPLSLSSLAASMLNQRQPANIQRRAVALAGALLEHSDAAARRAALDYCAQLMFPDEAHVAVPRLLELARTATRDEASKAFRALCGVCPAEDATLLRDALRDVLPDRLRLSEAVKALRFSRPFADDPRMQALARAAIAGLEADPVTAEMRAAIAITMLPAQNLAAFYLQLAARGEFHAGVLLRALDQMLRQMRRFSAAQLGTIEQALAASEDAHVRRLAFAFLLRRRARQGLWTDELVERLHRYRVDPAPVVATTAQLTFTSAEEADEAAGSDAVDGDFYADL